MSKSMKEVKTHLASWGIKPTKRNARKYLHYYRKLQRKVNAEYKRINSLVPKYELPDYNKEENNG